MSQETTYSYCVRKIAVEIQDYIGHRDVNDDVIFLYRKIWMRKLFDFDFQQISKDIFSNKDFSIKLVSSDSIESPRQLALFYSAHHVAFRPARRLSLIHLGFNVDSILPLASDEADSTEEQQLYQQRKKKISELYQSLRDLHSSDVIHSEIPENLQCDRLRATLRPYQLRAVRWLLHRETASETIPPNYTRISSPELPEVSFFLQPDYLVISDSQLDDIFLPTGGILADEMGLGKTVEMLTLILLNQRNLPNKVEKAGLHEEYKPKAKQCKLGIRCICGKTTNKNRIKCGLCESYQHKQCTRKYSRPSIDFDEEYICPKCWESQPLMKSSATIIVSPATIKQQWNSEIAKHSENVRVFSYDGVAVTGWISPVELGSYDVVLSDYNVFKREIYFSHDKVTQLSLRNQRKYVRKSSPLIMIDWWRVVLDEAQMVESGVSKCAQMTRSLSATHRWAVTGTPIQKSVDDIRGLLEFIGIMPFQMEHIWESLSLAFEKGNGKPLMDVLSKVMWRTCKSTVLEELGIPPQTEKVHYLTMSDAQRLFYRGQHASCSWAFENVIQKFSSTTPLSRLDPRSLNTILEPLRKLRQDCTVPVLFKKIEQSQVKKCLTPKELVAHLIYTNEMESKNHLRCMVSSINGQAALHIIRKEYIKAVDLYKLVLELADKYNDSISVDTLLQIHALHNLGEIHRMNPDTPNLPADAVNDYKSRCNKLEWKYISIYNENLLKARANLQAMQKAYLESVAKLPKYKEICWQNLLSALRDHNIEDRFLDRINEEFASNPMNPVQNFRMIEGLSIFLVNWVDKIFQLRMNVLEGFQKFESYTASIKPQNELTEEEKTTIETFVTDAFDCHLFELQIEETTDERRENNRFCAFCKAKKTLDEYECVIFSKVFDENRDNMEGTWKPTMQETICKAIYRFAKINNISDGENLADAKEFLKMVECMKNEYKEFVKLWIETEYTAKGYDEIDMCRLRLEVVESEGNENNEEEEEKKARHQVRLEEVGLLMANLTSEYHIAETDFHRKLARLKYIRHLESNEDPGICPVCNREPDAKYAMIQCGHHLCISCLIAMKEYQRNILTCPICRLRQKYDEIYYVTRKPNGSDLDFIEVKGQHSSKVEEIVREIIRLKMMDKDVKVIIFSHWYPILEVIAQGLQINDITYALKQNVTQAINSFKQTNSNITCLLLMLSQGSKGLNLTEATHVFLVEPILNHGEEQQAVSRIHRIGQTRPTTVHRFIMKDTIEEKIYNTVSNDEQGNWDANDVTVNNIRNLFTLE